MSHSARESIYDAIASIRLIDPHTHINPHAPASNTLADLLGYHYYTELAHSAGMPKDQIEEDSLLPRELVHRLVGNLSPIENTAQYRWLIEICRKFLGFEGERIDLSNWEDIYDSAERQMRLAEWPQMVLDQSNVEAVFLTNDFDDELSGFDSDTYIPCLRTDDLVFHLAKEQTRQRLAVCSGIELDGSLSSLRESLGQRFEHFVGNGARACAISLPPSFEPKPVSDGRAATALDEVLRKGPLADPSHQAAISRRVFWTLAELCDEYGIPFDLMIGVNRGVYEDGVYQGQDLYDSRVSLIQYRELFNSFPAVKFPISVLASVTNQELVSYAWIFPNVITNGHWWYSNTPSFIARDAAARLEAVPQTKQIGYYSDAYKLEFVWPKFDMYRRILAGILADHFVDGCGWSEERAVELGRQVLRDNVDEIFPRPRTSESAEAVPALADTWVEDQPEVISTAPEPANAEPANPEQSNWIDPAVAGSSATLAAGAIGMVEVNEPVEAEPEPDDSGSDEDDQSFSTDILPAPASSNSESSEQELELPHDLDDLPTLVDESGSTAETVRIDELGVDESNGETELPDLPTVVELADTVRIDESAPNESGDLVEQRENEEEDEEQTEIETWVDSSPMPEAADAPIELDPLPSDEEIQAIDVRDVELSDSDVGTAAPDADSIEAEAEAETLDVGDLLSEDDLQETPSPEIRMLRGEESFQPDEDSLRLKPDPLTGELTFPISTSNEEDADSLYQPSDDADVLYDPTDDADVLAEPTDADMLSGSDVLSEADGHSDADDNMSADDNLSLEETIELDEINFDEIKDPASPDQRNESGDPPR